MNKTTNPNPMKDVRSVMSQLSSTELDEVLSYGKILLAAQMMEYPLDFDEWDHTPEPVKDFVVRLSERYNTASEAYLNLLTDFTDLKHANKI